MSDSKIMTTAQIEDLLIEWDLYSEAQKAPILEEFHKNCNKNCDRKDFLHFLRNKLQIDGYWKKVGIT